MKTWQIVLIVAGAVVLLCCGGGGLVGYQIFRSARNVDAEADHYADAALPAIAANWNFTTLAKYRADEWKNAQSDEGTKQFLKMMKDGLGSLKSAEPFSAVYVGAQTVNGQSATVVTVVSKAQFEKAPGTATMRLIKENGEWKVLALKVNSHVFDSIGHFKPASYPLTSGERAALS